MNLFEQLETLRIPDNEILSGTFEEQVRFGEVNEMLDKCSEIIWNWLQEKGLLDKALNERIIL